MNDVLDQSHAAWSPLSDEWARAQEAWRDSAADFFDAQFWQPLERQSEEYRRAVEQLMELLQAAQEAAAAR